VADSLWQLTIPSDIPQFDFDTITDVIIHIRYTAREGGDILKSAAIQNLKNKINKAQTISSVLLLSIRHEFPTEWAKFLSVTIDNKTLAKLTLPLMSQHYPFWGQEILGKNSVKRVDFFAEMLKANSQTTTVNIYDGADTTVAKKDILSDNPSMGGLLTGTLAKIAQPPAITDTTNPWTIYLDNNSMKDIWIAITWGKDG
jgi:hypothetical protein